MSFLALPWRKQAWTFSRPGTVERNGLERPSPGTPVAVLCSTSAVTESLRRSRPGTSVKLALRLRTEDMAADIRRGDRAQGAWPFPGPGGVTVELHVDSVTPFERHRRIIAVDHLEDQ